MRQKRAKSYKKLMAMYHSTFGFRTPYQVLVDSSFCLDGARAGLLKLEAATKLINGVLQGNCKLMITQCCITELYKGGPSQQPTVDLAKTFERRKCNHVEPIAGDDCILAIVGAANKHRYVIATQSDNLRNKLRGIPATPIVHINRSVLVLEPPSEATKSRKAEIEEADLHASASEVLSNPTTKEQPTQPKRRGPKGPNPLSVKKKKNGPTKGSAPMASHIPQSSIGWKRTREDAEDNDGNDNSRSQNHHSEIHVVDGERAPRKRRRHKAKALDDAVEVGT
ncbi:hypothetical protein FRC02_004885 [Tulasnella sp. 418]|nr:hypothetical protein FRC02_004885 [Tulasnella sp. 418]